MFFWTHTIQVRQKFIRNVHRHVAITVEERLTDGIALIVVTGAGKGEEFRFKIRHIHNGRGLAPASSS